MRVYAGRGASFYGEEEWGRRRADKFLDYSRGCDICYFVIPAIKGAVYMREKLLKIIFENSFCFDPDFGFKLASGAKSDVYIDLKKTVLSAEGMELTGRVVFDAIKELDVEGVGGLTLGADPIAYATALISNISGKPLEAFVIRKETKKHGTMRWLEGNLKEGARVVIIDDVITTGGSTIKAIERAREAGLEVALVLALVDREEGGRENIAEICQSPFKAVFTKSDLMKLQERDAKAAL